MHRVARALSQYLMRCGVRARLSLGEPLCNLREPLWHGGVERGGNPRRGCDARIHMQLQAHGEGPGRTYSGLQYRLELVTR